MKLPAWMVSTNMRQLESNEFRESALRFTRVFGVPARGASYEVWSYIIVDSGHSLPILQAARLGIIDTVRKRVVESCQVEGNLK